MGEVFMGGSGGGGAKVKTGSVGVNSGKSASINLGFQPDLVILYSENNNHSMVAAGSPDANNALSYVPRILTKAFSKAGSITQTGFSVSTYTSCTLYYIAVKF